MASRRRNTFDNGSLDLLLDTITNAFGGILLIAILVVALLQTRSRKGELTDAAPVSNTTELATKLQELEEEISPLNLEVKAMDAISTKLADPDLRSTLSTLGVEKQQRDELATEKAKLLQSIADTQTQLSAIDEQDKSLTASIESESETLEGIRKGLEEERAKRKINSPFPEEKAASNRHYAVTMKYGRWYVERSSAGAPNLDDFAVLDSSGEYLTITPKPYRGIVVIEDGKLATEIVNQLKEKSPREVHIDISIWDDSYEAFQVLREHLVENKFEYRLIVVTDGDEVVETIVTDAKVQ